jgi:hypothetical protein
VPYLPDISDIAPSDFWLFGHVKNSLAGRTFDEPEQLLDEITEFLDEIQPSELEIVFSHWLKKVRCVLDNNGDYYHKQSNRFQKPFSVGFPGRWWHYLMTPYVFWSTSH